MGCSSSKSSETKDNKKEETKKEETKKEETKKEETKKEETKKEETKKDEAKKETTKKETTKKETTTTKTKTEKKVKYEDLSESDRKKIEKAFNKADKNKNGSIDRKELLTVFFDPSKCNDPNFKPGEKVNAFLAEFDKNQDGNVTFEEFKEVIANYPNRDELIKQLRK